jgi:CheY-like chemotaxis protein
MGITSISASTLEGVKVLFVDDDFDSREMTTSIVKQFGAQVTSVSSVSEALEVIGELEPDVIVSDIEMPIENGYMLIQRVRSLDNSRVKDVPALALTAHAKIEDKLRILASGFQEHLAKPFNPAELILAIAILSGHANNLNQEAGLQ